MWHWKAEGLEEFDIIWKYFVPGNDTTVSKT